MTHRTWVREKVSVVLRWFKKGGGGVVLFRCLDSEVQPTSPPRHVSQRAFWRTSRPPFPAS